MTKTDSERMFFTSIVEIGHAYSELQNNVIRILEARIAVYREAESLSDTDKRKFAAAEHAIQLILDEINTFTEIYQNNINERIRQLRDNDE